MSGTRTAGPAGGRTAAVVAGVAVAVVGLLAVLSAMEGGGRAPLDPRSHARTGTSAMVALARELGAEVTIADDLGVLEDPGVDVVVLLTDTLGEEQRRAVEAWVADGGRLVVTDPGSELAPPATAEFRDVADLGRRAADCDIAALDGIAVEDVEPRSGGVLFDPPADADACIRDGLGDAYVVARDRGEGTVVAVGGSGMVVNDGLAEGENAPVVAALVAPEPGTEVVVLEPGPLAGASGDQRTLVDLIPTGVRAALVQLTLAFVVYALWRARRLGRPLAEPQPVAVAGSELVVAVGSLLDRSGSTDRAGALLRDDLRRFLVEHLGLPPTSPPAVVAEVAADRTGLDHATVLWALSPGPVPSEEALVTLAHTVQRIRKEVLAHV
ncbi:MAG: DUF4350 domain-containing protein [Thermoanaerobacterales bacterium]|nr:hypothetical protein [Thermoanaerobacterales bacterium]